MHASSQAPIKTSTKSITPSKTPLWLQEYVTKPGKTTCFYQIDNQLTYSKLSKAYQQALYAYSAICEPYSFSEVADDPA